MIDWQESAGFALAPLVWASELPELIGEAERLFATESRRAAGVRRALTRSALLSQWVESSQLIPLVASIIGPGAKVVRSILFDKTPEANWDVAWHQDTTIAVETRSDVEGFGPWSVKDGTPHVRPPVEVLESMLTARVHLDASHQDNGPLLVAPGTHRDGIRTASQFDLSELAGDAHICTARAGDMLLMRPLLFHASRKSQQPGHRRVLHLEFAACELPPPLCWTKA